MGWRTRVNPRVALGSTRVKGLTCFPRFLKTRSFWNETRPLGLPGLEEKGFLDIGDHVREWRPDLALRHPDVAEVFSVTEPAATNCEKKIHSDSTTDPR
jgi:hypothetical protein